MVILTTPTSHGPHIWWPANMWCADGHYMDFLRLAATGVHHDRNTYTFQREGDAATMFQRIMRET